MFIEHIQIWLLYAMFQRNRGELELELVESRKPLTKGDRNALPRPARPLRTRLVQYCKYWQCCTNREGAPSWVHLQDRAAVLWSEMNVLLSEFSTFLDADNEATGHKKREIQRLQQHGMTLGGRACTRVGQVRKCKMVSTLHFVRSSAF